MSEEERPAEDAPEPSAHPPEADVEAEAEPETLEAQLEKASADAQRYLANWQRAEADFSNYKRRMEQERGEAHRMANAALIINVLPVLDDLERALDAAAKHEEVELEEGVRLVHRELSHVLAQEGLVAIESDGRFDPHEHEALLTQPSEAEEGAIIQVLQKGYRLGDRVLRPARVVLSQGLQEAQTGE